VRGNWACLTIWPKAKSAFAPGKSAHCSQAAGRWCRNYHVWALSGNGFAKAPRSAQTVDIFDAPRPARRRVCHAHLFAGAKCAFWPSAYVSKAQFPPHSSTSSRHACRVRGVPVRSGAGPCLVHGQHVGAFARVLGSICASSSRISRQSLCWAAMASRALSVARQRCK